MDAPDLYGNARRDAAGMKVGFDGRAYLQQIYDGSLRKLRERWSKPVPTLRTWDATTARLRISR